MRIAILGASARAAAFSALRAGIEPVTADLFADRDLGRRCESQRVRNYPSGLRDYLTGVSADGWLYTGAVENHPDLLNDLEELLPLWGCSADIVRRVRCPEDLSTALRNDGLRFPETRRHVGGVPADGSWLKKPEASAGGNDIEPYTGPVGQRNSHRPAVWQRFIPGAACSAVYMGNGQESKLLGITEQLLGGDAISRAAFRYAGSIGPRPLEAGPLGEVQRIGGSLARAFSLIGIYGVDFVLTADNEVWPVEVNPRYTASVEIIERVTQEALMAWHVRACREGWLPAAGATTGSGHHGKVVLYARYPVVVPPAFSEWAQSRAEEEPWPLCGDVPSAGQQIDAGKPVMTLFASGTDSDSVRSALCQRQAEANRRLYPAD